MGCTQASKNIQSPNQQLKKSKPDKQNKQKVKNKTTDELPQILNNVIQDPEYEQQQLQSRIVPNSGGKNIKNQILVQKQITNKKRRFPKKLQIIPQRGSQYNESTLRTAIRRNQISQIKQQDKQENKIIHQLQNSTNSLGQQITDQRKILLISTLNGMKEANNNQVRIEEIISSQVRKK